jgi:hypothetical protein
MKERQPGMFITGKEALWFFVKVVFWAAVIWVFIMGMLSL